MFKTLSAFALLIPLCLSAQTTLIPGNRTIEGSLNYGTESGSTNSFVVANPTGATITTYKRGASYSFIASHANTGASTINIDGVGVKALVRNGSTALVSGDIANGSPVSVMYDGTQFQVTTPSANAASSSNIDASQVTSGLLPVARGGTGTATPGLVGGTNVTVSGTWPNQTINSAATGGGLTALNPSPAGTYGSSSSVPVVVVDAYGRITSVSTATVSGGGGGGAVSSGTLASRPAASSGALYVATDQPAGQQLYYASGGTWYQLGLTSGNFSVDSSGRLDINASNIPQLGVPNTFGNYQNYFPSIKIGTCVQSDGTTPCWGAGSNTLIPQQNGATISPGTFNTLNLGTGLSGVLSGGVLNVTATGGGSGSSLSAFAQDGSGNITMTSSASAGSTFGVYNSNATANGVHNYYFGTDTNGGMLFQDVTAGTYSVYTKKAYVVANGGVIVNGGGQTRPTCDSTNGPVIKGEIFYQYNGGTSDDVRSMCMYKSGAWGWISF